KKTIDNHVETELEKRKLEEIERKAEVEKEKIKKEVVEEYIPKDVTPERSDNPFVNIDNPFNTNDDSSILVTRKYIVKGTVGQLQSLEYVMSETVSWSVEK